MADVLTRPAHPYTEGLLAAVPSLDLRSLDDLRGIPGRVPPPSEWGDGCTFQPRCPRSRGADCRSCCAARAGFSLLELMGVLLILSMLAGLVVGQSHLAKLRGEEARARAELGQIQAALERYHDAFGEYPRSTSVSGGAAEDRCEVTNLYAWAHAPDWMLATGKDSTFCLCNYFPEALHTAGEPPTFTGLDPWNRPYYYHHDPDVSPDTYRVYSRGPNDPDGTRPDRWIAP